MNRLNELVTQMEQKEKATETALLVVERELNVKQQVLDLHKKKVSLFMCSDTILSCKYNTAMIYSKAVLT